jgi:hypothetical protein
MTSNIVMLEPETIADLTKSLKTEFRKVNLGDVKILAEPAGVRIEMPIKRLTDYRFVSNLGRCSWTTPKGTVVLQLKRFSVEQRAEKQLFCMNLRELFQETPSNIREIFLTRSLRALAGLKSLDEDHLLQAVKASSDYSVLAAALNTDEALAAVRADDPLAGARLRGMDAKRKLLESEGGAISSPEAADLLGVTRQAIDKRRNEGKLLALELGKRGYFYPSWQFGLIGIEKVLSVLKGRDSWERLSFFLNPSDLLEGRTPLEALRTGKDIEEVTKAAKTYGEHGA